MQQARELIEQVRKSADEIHEKVRREQQKTNLAVSQMSEINAIVNHGFVHGELPVVAKTVRRGAQGGLYYRNAQGKKVYLGVSSGQKQQCLDGNLPGALSGCGG